MQYAEQPRAARARSTAPTSRAPASSARPSSTTPPLMRELLELRHEEAQAARLRQLRRSVAGAEDGRVARSRCSTSCATWRAARVRSAEHDLAELREFAATELGLAELQAWDLAFAARSLKRAALRVQRPGGEAVLHRAEGARRACSASSRRCSRWRSAPTRAPVWHPSVRFFRIERAAAGRRPAVGQFYLDPYARPGKRPGAWMDDARDRWVRPEGNAADAGRAPDLQLRRAGRRQARRC